MNDTHKSKHEYEQYQGQDGFVLPILCVRGCGFDWNRSLVTLASYWNGYLALKRTETVFSVLNFLMKNAKFVFAFERNFQVLCIRVAFCLCMGMF